MLKGGIFGGGRVRRWAWRVPVYCQFKTCFRYQNPASLQRRNPQLPPEGAAIERVFSKSSSLKRRRYFPHVFMSLSPSNTVKTWDSTDTKVVLFFFFVVTDVQHLAEQPLLHPRLRGGRKPSSGQGQV